MYDIRSAFIDIIEADLKQNYDVGSYLLFKPLLNALQINNDGRL
jgi:hypothetical protein